LFLVKIRVIRGSIFVLPIHAVGFADFQVGVDVGRFRVIEHGPRREEEAVAALG
jgi:hypothetical protein